MLKFDPTLVLNKDAPFLPHYSAYEFKTYLDDIGKDSPCLFNTVIVIMLYFDNVVLNQEHAYKDLLTSYMSYVVLLA